MTREGRDSRGARGAVLPGLRLLLVEDDRRVREALQQLLTGRGYQVLAPVAWSDLEAVLAGPSPPNVAVVDVAIPAPGDGVRVISTLARLGCPVLAISITARHRSTALAAGASAFVEKDANTEELLTTTDLLCTHRRRAS